GQAPVPPPGPQSAEFFESRVRPILAANCYDCHTDERMAGLRVDSRDGLLKGGRSGPAIVPGDPERSLLIQAVRQTGALKMPKGGQLAPSEIDALAQWVRDGAVWPVAPVATSSASSAPTAAASLSSAASVGKPATTSASPAYVITPEQRAFWSFQPIRKPPVPVVKDTAWPRTEIDRFVLARLERDGLAPVKAADRATLLRRASLDLI